MNDQTLFQSVDKLAQLTSTLSDEQMNLSWAWRAHNEGARFALLGSSHELRALAVSLAAERAENGPSMTKAQHALAQYHLAYRELQVVLLGVTAEDYAREPAAGEWPLRTVVGHIVGAERYFFSLIHYGLQRQCEGGTQPVRFPNEEVERLFGTNDEFEAFRKSIPLAELQAFYESLHQRTLHEFSSISNQELQAPSLWWEGEEVSLQYRIHRLEAHLRQHTVQAEKTLAMLGHPPNEAKRLLRHLYNALAEVEGITIGAKKLGLKQQHELAKVIAARAEEIAELVRGEV